MVKKFFIVGCMLFSSTTFAKVSTFQQNLNCMVRTTIAEAENQSKNAKIGVLYTIHNRAKASNKSYCSIVNAKNQFSHRRIKIDRQKHKEIFELAFKVMLEKIDDVTHGGTFFHDDSIKNPFRHVKYTGKFDNMVFYKAKALSKIFT